MPGEWLTGLDDANRAAIVGKGWDKLEPGAAVVAALNEAGTYQKQLTIPSDEIARIPKDPNAPEWATLYERLGKPKEAAAYDFADVKFANGKPLEAEDVEYLRTAAHEMHLSVPAAKALATKFVSYNDRAAARAATQTEARTASEMVRLDGMWGGQKQANDFLANEAMMALKLPDTVISAFKQNADAMEAMRNLGVRLKESGYAGGSGGPRPGDVGTMTAPQALARIEELKRDQGWISRWAAGGADEVRLLGDLSRVSLGGPQR